MKSWDRSTVWMVLVTFLLLVAPSSAVSKERAALGPSDLAQGDEFLISLAEGSVRGAPAAAYNDDLDEYLVVWADGRENGAYWDVYGQIVTANGAPSGENFVIRDEATNTLAYPDIAYDTVNERYLVVWYDMTEIDVEGRVLNNDGSAFGSAFKLAEGTSTDMRGFPAVAFHPQIAQYLVAYHGGAAGDLNVYGKKVEATGTVGATEYAVSTAAGDQAYPDVSVDPATNGDFLVVWQDGRAATEHIYGCLVYSTWLLGAEFIVAAPSDPLYRPAVAFNPAAGTAGEWLVVYYRDVAGDDQIRGRRVTAAGVPTGTGLTICDDAGDQRYPDVAYNAYGNDQWLVVWEDHRAGATNYDIYGRRVDVDGNTLGDAFAILNPTDFQSYPAVASSSTSDGYLVVLSDFATDNVVGQRVLTAGTLMGTMLTISTPVDDQQQPVAAYNSTDGEYLVVWHDRRAGNLDIWGQRVGLDGSLLGGSFAICSEAGAQTSPHLAYNLDTNQYLVVWEDRRADADIYGQRVNANGSLDGAEVPIAGAGTTARRVPRVAFNPISGEYLVVYAYEAEINNIRGRRVPPGGTPTEAEFDIATGATDQNYPDVACRSVEPGGGGYLVVWRDTDGTQRDIKGQRLNQTGGLLGSLDICTDASDQWTPVVAYSPDNDRYLVAWPDSRGATRDVYGRQVGGAGALYPEFALSTASGDQSRLAITYGSGSASYIVAWDDTRNASTTPDLYGQRVAGNGVLIDTDVTANDLLYTGPGEQRAPALAWAGTETVGLLAWEDDRNGVAFDIYGLRLEGAPVVTGSYIFLPLAVKH
ncbi:MAG: hypothetical protein JXA93_24265 [Anaerolineae bacterium]|nr:hypothetical protein [Anaerolineae bacterium]